MAKAARCLSLYLSLLGLIACGKGGGSSNGTTPTPPNSNDAVSSKGGGCYPVGIGATALAMLPLVDPEWAPVRDGATPRSRPVLVHGTAVESHVSRGDFPSTHLTYDQNTSLTLDAADAGLLATGNTGAEGETLELEWETGSYPDWAWADAGDRVVAMGRWIFDCGHPDPLPGTCAGTTKACVLDADCGSGVACNGTQFMYRSELHPPQATAVIRAGRGAPLADAGGVVPVTLADFYVSPDGGGAGDECVVTHRDVNDILGAPCFPLKAPLAMLPASAPPLATDFEVDVPLPAAPAPGAQVAWQLLPQMMADGAAPAVQAAEEVTPVLDAAAPHLTVKVLMSKAVGGKMPTGYASRLVAGWKQTPPATLKHVRLTVQGIVVHDALKPVPGAGLAPPAGWHLETSVNGEWRQLPGLDTVASGAEGTSVDTSGVVYDQYLPADGTLTVESSGASKACVDAMFGQSLATSLAQFGNITVAAACLQTVELDAGTVKASFAGPDFGQGTHEVASDVGSYTLRFTVELPTPAASVAGGP
jgi:hypothetical protein